MKLHTITKLAVPLLTSLLAFGASYANAKSPEDHTTVLRGRLGYLSIHSDLKSENPSVKANQKFKDGFVGEVGLGYFLNRYIAVEFDAGLEYAEFKNNAGNSKGIYSVPLQTLLQLHVPIHSTVRPYIGGGYVYRLVNNNMNNVKIENAGGAVAQLGVDFFPSESIGFNIDAKYNIALKNKITDNNQFFHNKSSVVNVTVGVVIPF